MPISLRIQPRDGQVIDRDRPISFLYNGKTVAAFAGRTLSPALSAEEMKDAILTEVEQFLEGTPLADDLSLICIRRDQ